MTKARSTRYGKIGDSVIEIGRFTYGHELMRIEQFGEGAKLKIGAFCSIAEGVVVFLGGNHRADWITTFPFGHIFQEDLGGEEIVGHPMTKGDVMIGNDVWIGQNATIMSGVNVGDGAIIAANSTIVKNIGCYEVWGGNPGRLLKMRFDPELITELTGMSWWDWDVDVIKSIAPILSQKPTMESLKNLQQMAQIS